ncbi:MAG: hypothetical protein A3C02_00770 [Candidatus Andersenbacteria bacterium RIFCSPHIGHO2_02_FULL_45_11]|uniref:thioredoxin-dependent peroxiredoxin n=1 Tax=Candidatus Andersenbacteria bacterium RIFCSPHIGHO2_12_FULL_45_11 TaxID=1797281 RepID=A0A1G1X4E7_9BACT|nr:MAG: hypothetical protein A2805_01660 [Candidatus Andersenbacteria bacterium RIFCSPHIGHO2_01_FULL_46_36]OGY33317.1 MAG: hypothetical protein A3C02_00770 [Candidatus Andersenbacteria bacterium RIFCSPHIGHO2_02_FULL_45_11]OGY34671.1 MAG: hypothetical protein A3D99_05015 [Candidatus Andersenbacteria bacterium RIFCSPHIGHO2_12_FULL_45_11]
MLKEGTKAPEFTAEDQYGDTHTLAQYAGKYVVLYFYPKDDTPGCTKEACAIRDAWSDFADHKIAVLGVSADSVKSHEKFSKKFGLPFPLLSDPDKKILNGYEVIGMKKMWGREYEGILRITYLIAPDGTIAKVYPKVKPADHAQEILADIAALQS